jgi:hypothetical protein
MNKTEKENVTVENEAKKSKKWRKTKIFFSCLGIFFAILIAALIICPGFIVEKSLPKIATLLLDTKVEVASVNINVFAGSVRINELKVHNYKDYSTPYALELGHMFIDVSLLSLFSDKIEIEDVTIEQFSSSVEFRNFMRNNNLGDIAEKLQAGEKKAMEKKAEKKKETVEEAEKEAKKMVIRKLRFADSKIIFQHIPILFPDVELTDVGDGRPISDFFVVIMDTTVELVMNAGKGITDAAGKGVEKLGEGAKKIGEGVNTVYGGGAKAVDDTVKATGELVEGVKNLFK